MGSLLLCERMALSPADQQLACSYAVLVLHDSGAEVSGDQISKLLKAAKVDVEAYWPMLFAGVPSKSISKALREVSSGGGGGAAAGGAAAEVVEEEEEEEEMAPAASMFDAAG